MKKWYPRILAMLLLVIIHQQLSAQCTGCTTTISTSTSASYTVNTGEKLCITSAGTVKGSITCNGGTICNEGTINSALLVFTNATINNYGTFIARGSITLNSSIFNNYGAPVKVSCALYADVSSKYVSDVSGKMQITPFPTVELLATASSICTGQSLSLTASGASTYSWQPATGLSATTGTVVTATPTVTTTYTLTGTSSKTCMGGTSTLAVTVYTVIPTVAVNPSSSTICGGSNMVLTASGGNTYVWSPSTGLNSVTSGTVTAQPAATVFYVVTGTNTYGCTNSASAFVKVRPLIQINTISMDSLVNGTDTIHYRLYGADLSGTYKVGKSYKHCPSPSGNTNTVGLSFYSAADADSLKLKFNLDSISQISQVKIIWNDTLKDLDTNYFNIDNSRSLAIKSPSNSHQPDGTLPPIQILLENGLVMSPNGDSNFDHFVVEGLEPYTSYNLSIGDIFGNIIYTTNVKTNTWDGKDSNNHLVAVGTYQYQIDVDGTTYSGQFLVEY